MTIKALWVTSVYPSDQRPGNGVFHELQVQALKQIGVDVKVICPTPRQPAVTRFLKKSYQLPYPEASIRNGIEVYRPEYLALPGQLRWAQPDRRLSRVILQTIFEQKLRPDLVHAHFAMPSGGATRLVAEKLNLPWVLTLHGSDVNRYPNFSSSARKAFIRSVTSANNVVAVGERLKLKTQDLTGITPAVMPIGVDLSQFRIVGGSKQQLKDKLNLPQNKKIVMYIGRLVEAKGLHELIKALNHLPDEVAIAMVGDGPEKGKLSQHPELNKRLFLIGQVENEKIKDYLKASDAFVLPSYSEGVPTVLIEALASKVPVISTSVGGIPDLFGDYQDFLIEPKSVNQLVKQIVSVLYRNLYPESMIEELYQGIQRNYQVQENAKDLLALYLETIKGAKPAAEQINRGKRAL